MKTLYFEDLVEGSVSWGGSCVVDGDEMRAYARANDPWPFHVDPEAARQSPYGGLTASGGYAITLWYRLGHPLLNGADEKWAFLGGFDWNVKFRAPIRPGDRLRHRRTLLSKRPSSKPGRGIVTNLTELVNHAGEPVLSIEAVMLVATRPES